MRWAEEKPIATLFFFSVICMIPAFFFGVSGFDAPIHGQWNEAFLKLLSEGNLRPTHAHEMFSGYGSYVFFFYPPLSFYLTALPMSILGDTANISFIAISTSAFLAIFASGISCYYWIRFNFEKRIALVSAILYIVFPQHLFSHYFNASTSQVWAFAFFPLVMLAIQMIVAGKRNGIILYALGQGCLTLTNIPMLIVFSPLAFLYGLLLSRDIKVAIKLGLGAILSFALAAFYLLPMFLLKEQINIGGHWSGEYGFDYNRYFVFASEFLELDEIGNKTYFYTHISNLVIFVWILIALVMVRKLWADCKTIFVIILLSLLLALPFSYIAWEYLPFVKIVQFPYRFLWVSGVFLIPLFAAYYSKDKLDSLVLIILPLLAISCSLAFGRGQDNFPEHILKTNKEKIEYYPNYIPYSKQLLKMFYNEIERAEIPKVRIARVSGDVEFELIKEEARLLEAQVSSQNSGELNIRWFYIDGWKAEIEGQELTVREEPLTKTMLIDIPAKTEPAKLKIYLPYYWHEKLGYLISLLSVLLIAGIYFRNSKNAKI